MQQAVLNNPPRGYCCLPKGAALPYTCSREGGRQERRVAAIVGNRELVKALEGGSHVFSFWVFPAKSQKTL